MVLHAYAEFGADCVNRINGIFAFAVWEEHRKRLFVARDRIGVKPLFYRQQTGGFLFASEIKTILAYPSVRAQLDEEGARQLILLGLYNASGPGQTLDDSIREQIVGIKEKIDLKILVTLSCSMCPDLVVAAQRIASVNPNVAAHVYDVHHFEKLKRQYHVMSVPCLVVNDQKVFFGKKSIHEVLQLLKQL